MSKIKIFLKSGHTVDIECGDWELRYDNKTLEYNGYVFKDLKKVKQVGFVPSQIAGYIEY
jgi:hypothetical protein